MCQLPDVHAQHNWRTKAALQSAAVDTQESLMEYPWDDDDSLHKSEEAFKEDNFVSGAHNHQAGVYYEFTSYAALRLVIPFNTKQFHKHKLLNILSEANASH